MAAPANNIDTAATLAVAATPADDAHIPPIEYPPVSARSKLEGKCTIIGFGSLLSARSAASTFGSVMDFRPGLIRDYRRVFAHVAPIFIERGIVNLETKEMSSLSVEPCPGATLLVSVFEIPLSALPAFYLREMEFRWLHVPVFDPSGTNLDARAVDGQGLLCAAYTDEEYRSVRLRGSAAAFHQAFGRWGVQKIWRDDLLPCPIYLRHVVLAAAGMDRSFFQNNNSSSSGSGKDAAARATTESASTTIATSSEAVKCEVWGTPALMDIPGTADADDVAAASSPPSYLTLPCGVMLSSFLDSTFLGDRLTSVRSYLRSNPRVMLQQPPESLKERYSG